MFAVPNDDPYFSNAFFDAMQSFKATWLWHYLPRPHGDLKAVLLPRSDERSMKVAELMHRAGLLDLGLVLGSLGAAASNSLM